MSDLNDEVPAYGHPMPNGGGEGRGENADPVAGHRLRLAPFSRHPPTPQGGGATGSRHPWGNGRAGKAMRGSPGNPAGEMRQKANEFAIIQVNPTQSNPYEFTIYE